MSLYIGLKSAASTVGNWTKNILKAATLPILNPMLRVAERHPSLFNKVAAGTTIVAGIFAFMAIFIPIAAPIAGPIGGAFALISGCSWLLAAHGNEVAELAHKKETAALKELQESAKAKEQCTTKEKSNEKTAGKSIQSVNSTQYHTHHAQDVRNEKHDHSL